MGDSEILSLLYLYNTAELTETRRILRLKGKQAARKKFLSLLEQYRIFLRGLAADIGIGR
jgi:hypothetical protein